METIYRIICALCIISLRFPLYYLAPIKSLSYTDVMNNDTNLCDNPIKQFLSKSEYTKQCTTLTYPRDIDKLILEYDTMETFLCLGMHDAIYKVCQYVTNKKWTNKFNETEDFDLSIQNITGFKSSGEVSSPNMTIDEKSFCEVLSGYTPMYEKVQPALLKLSKSLKDPIKCNKICVDLNQKLNPLCILLAWINRIDQNITSSTIVRSNSESPIKNQERASDTNHQKQVGDIADPVSPGKIEKNTAVNQLSNTVKPIIQDQNLNHILQLPNNPINNVDAPNEGSPVADKLHVKNSNNNKKSQTTTTKTTVQADVSELEKPINESHSKPHDNSQQHDNDAHQLPKNDNPKVIVNNDKESTIDKNVNSKTISPQIEEIKSTTLSENTQDNVVEDNVANNPNGEDFSRVDDDQLANNLIDTLGQPMEADDRNLEISPKEMDTIRVIKNDEESHFFTYFVISSLGFIGGYLAYSNKQKILAIILEGRRSKNNRGRRRPSTANYRKLDCTLEEAVTSQCNANVTHVIY